jgi:hypothetical protein
VRQNERSRALMFEPPFDLLQGNLALCYKVHMFVTITHFLVRRPIFMNFRLNWVPYIYSSFKNVTTFFNIESIKHSFERSFDKGHVAISKYEHRSIAVYR